MEDSSGQRAIRTTGIMVEEKILSRDHIVKVDAKKVYELYESWPKRAEEALKTKVEFSPKKYDRVAYLAVGGSATAGDIISDWLLSSGGVEVSVFRGGLPKVNLDNTLVIVCSTSGDTEETLRMASATSMSKPDMVTISHNGKLKEMAEREGLVHVQIGLAEAPRYSLPYSLFASIAVMRSASLLEGIEWELDETISTMKRIAPDISSSSDFKENVSKQVGWAVHSHEPCVYTSSVTKSVARRFKNSLNENAKMHARFDSAPDFLHNEVEAWEDDDKDLMPVMLRRSREPSFEARALDAFQAMLASRGVMATEVKGQGDGNLSQLMDLVFTLDFASYYAAIARQVDPFEISLIKEMKKTR